MDKRIITVGRVTLTIEAESDDSGMDHDYLGEFVDYRHAVRTFPQFPIYSRETDSILIPGSGVWKDRKGRITQAPNLDGHWARDWDFLKLEGAGNGYSDCKRNRLTYLFQDADRLRGLDRGDWCYMGVVATVSLLGREVAHASVWGIESDSEESYFQECARDMAHEAMKEAKAFKQSIVA